MIYIQLIEIMIVFAYGESGEKNFRISMNIMIKNKSIILYFFEIIRFTSLKHQEFKANTIMHIRR